MNVSQYNDRHSISEIIRYAAKKMVEQTQAAVNQTEGADPGEDFVSVMVNGTEKKLTRSNYETLKRQNKEIQSQMKEQLKDFINVNKKTKI